MHSSMAVMNEAEIKITMTWPPTQEVLDKIEAETLVAHAVRQLLQKKERCDHHDGDDPAATCLQPGGMADGMRKAALLSSWLWKVRNHHLPARAQTRHPRTLTAHQPGLPKHNTSHHKMLNKMLPWIVKLPPSTTLPTTRCPTRCYHGSWSCQGQTGGENHQNTNLEAWLWRHLQRLHIFGAGEGKCSDWWPKEAHWRPDRGECHLMWSGGIGPWQRGSSQVSCRNVGSFAVFTKDELATSPRSTSRWDGHQSLIAGKVLYAARCVKVFLPLHPLLQTSSGKQYQPLFKRPCSFFSLLALLTLNAGYFWEPATKWPRVCLFAWLACEKRPWKQPRRNWSLEMVGVGLMLKLMKQPSPSTCQQRCNLQGRCIQRQVHPVGAVERSARPRETWDVDLDNADSYTFSQTSTWPRCDPQSRLDTQCWTAPQGSENRAPHRFCQELEVESAKSSTRLGRPLQEEENAERQGHVVRTSVCPSSVSQTSTRQDCSKPEPSTLTVHGVYERAALEPKGQSGHWIGPVAEDGHVCIPDKATGPSDYLAWRGWSYRGCPLLCTLQPPGLFQCRLACASPKTIKMCLHIAFKPARHDLLLSSERVLRTLWSTSRIDSRSGLETVHTTYDLQKLKALFIVWAWLVLLHLRPPSQILCDVRNVTLSVLPAFAHIMCLSMSHVQRTLPNIGSRVLGES